MIDIQILKQKNKQNSFDYIYKEINDFILEKNIPYERKYKNIDKLIEDFIKDDEFEFHNHVALLISTHHFKHKLRNRKLLWEKTIEKAEKENLLDEQMKITLNVLE